VLGDAQSVIDSARRYCDVRSNPVPNQSADVEPYYFNELKCAVDKLFGQKGSAAALEAAKSGGAA